MFLGLNQAYATDIVGKWTTTVKYDRFAYSEIEITTEFREDGIFERFSKGIYMAQGKKAEYTFIEKSKWYIEDGYLYSEILDSNLEDMNGDSSLIEIIKLFYMEGVKVGGINRNKILELNSNQLILLIEYGDGYTEKAVLTKLN